MEDVFQLRWPDLLTHKRARERANGNGNRDHDRSGNVNRNRSSNDNGDGGSEANFDGRNPFEKDYHRIILSASFRRLQDKTQVFPLDQSDFVRTRLTHSLEVSSLAKSLGEQVSHRLQGMGLPNAPNEKEQKEIADLLLCSGLLHDIGNPPFGHYGETTIQDWYRTHLDTMLFRDKPLSSWLLPQMREDLRHFEGNAQAIRLVSKLHYLVDEHGMNLSYSLLNTLMKYPVSSLMIDKDSEDTRYHKMGYFYAERDLFRDITEATGTLLVRRSEDLLLGSTGEAGAGSSGLTGATGSVEAVERHPDLKQLSFAPDTGNLMVCRHPLTYLMEAADDISYRTADLEDASRKGKITFGQLKNCLRETTRIRALTDEQKLVYYMVIDELDEKLVQALDRKNQNPELYAIQNWLVFVQSRLIREVTVTFCDHYGEIMEGRYLHDLFHNNLAGLLLDVLGDIAYDFVFSSQSIVQLEVASDAIIGGLLDKFVPACLHYDTELPRKPVDQRLMALISDNYRALYWREAEGKSEGERLYLRLLLVNDYICGMTDSFAKDLYHKFNGIY